MRGASLTHQISFDFLNRITKLPKSMQDVTVQVTEEHKGEGESSW